MVIVALLILFWLAWMAISAVIGGSDSAAAANPQKSPSFGLSLSDDPSDEASDAASAGANSKSASATDSASPANGATGATGATGPTGPTGASGSASASGAGAACQPGNITVTAVPGSASMASGSGTSLTLSVANSGAAACTREVGSGANEIQVLSAGKVVWSSDDCNPSQATKEVEIAPGTPWTATVSWDGRGSAAGCASAAATALPAGSYQVVARNGKAVSAPVTVTIQ